MKSDINGIEIIFFLAGNAALLLWGARMVRTGVMRAYGGSLRANIRKNLSNRFLASLAGIFAALLLQSSTAVALLTTSFASASLIPLATGLAIMLGADVGAAVVAQLLSLNIKDFWPVLLLIGYIVHNIYETKNTKAKQIGRILLGFAFILSALSGLSSVAAGLQQNDMLIDILFMLSSDAILTVFVAVIVTYFVHSSLAVVLLVAGLSSSNIIPHHLVFLFIIGINIGGALPAVVMTLKEAIVARRIIIGNFLFRIIIGMICLLFHNQIATFIDYIYEIIGGSDYFEFTVFVHVLFNVVLFFIFINFVKPASALLKLLLKENASQENNLNIDYLKTSALEIPEIALNLASREVLRLADKVQYLMQNIAKTLDTDNLLQVEQYKEITIEISENSLNVRNYLIKLSRLELNNSESNRIVEIIKFANILENISRDINRNIFSVIEKMTNEKKHFSSIGHQEIIKIVTHIETSFCLAVRVFMESDKAGSEELIKRDITFRNAENESRLAHLSRLSNSDIRSQETSVFHLDILRDLKNINNNITSIAQSFLEMNQGDLVVDFRKRD